MNGSTPKQNAPESSKPRQASCRILVVDDSEIALEATARYLQLCGHTVCKATDGQSAIDSASEFKPQKALLDLSLPDMDGYELMRRLKALAGLEDTVFIAVTGFGEEERSRAEGAGFAHFVTKPIDMEVLAKLIERESPV